MIGILKAVAGWVIPIGAEAIVGGITANAVKNMGTGMKAAACLTSFVVGWWVGDNAVVFFDDKLDELKGKWDQYQLKGADE